MDKKYQAFVSSTFADLEDERKIVTDMLLQHGFIAAGMENFPASQLQQLDFIKPVIDASDIYILVIGARYGSLTPTGISYTEEEYNYAKSQGKIILSFLHKNPKSIAYEKWETDPEKTALLNKFKEEVKSSKLCKIWDNPYELSTQVAASIFQAVATHGSSMPGWVRGGTGLSAEVEMRFTEARIKIAEQSNEIGSLKARSDLLESAVLAQFNDAMKPATPAEYDAWEEGAIKQGQPQKLLDSTAHLGDKKFANKDFVLPELYGTRALTIIIPENIRVYKNNIGHSTLLYMNEFRVEGVIAELNSKRRIE